jgi:oligoendopeptidase F
MTQRATDVPRWDIASLYQGFDAEGFGSPAYQAVLQAYRTGMDELDSVLEAARTLLGARTGGAGAGSGKGFDFPLWLSRYLEIAGRTGAAEESLNAFASALYSTDTTNAEYLNNLSKLEGIGLRSRAQTRAFRRILSAHAKDMEAFYARFPAFAPYRSVLASELIASYHLMSDAEESLADELERTGGAAWGRLHEQLISTLSDPESGKTFNEIRSEAYSADRSVRKAAWETELRLLKSEEISLAAALNNLKGATVALNKRRSWDSAVARSLHAARLSAKTLDALLAAIEDSLPLWRQYLRTKGRLLTGADSGCAFYDLFAPLPPPKADAGGGYETARDARRSAEGSAEPGAGDRVWSFQAAKEYRVEKFAGFSADMSAFAERAFAQRWIDAEVRAGKVGGAYCTDFPAQGQSRVLCNFTGAFSDITTLAHELGHAYHRHCIAGLDYGLQHYPMTLAETASIFAETIVMRDVIAKAERHEKARLAETYLQDSCQVLVDILCRFYFEQSVFEARKDAELSAADFCRLMAAAQEKSYGAGLSSERHEYMWAVKSHYYSPVLDFYNFPYAFGLLFGTALYGRYCAEGAAFSETYVRLLRETGSASCEDVCRRAGFAIEKPEFWASGIASITAFYTEHLAAPG